MFAGAHTPDAHGVHDAQLGMVDLLSGGTHPANRLLAALPARNYRRLSSGLEPVELHFGDVLYQAGQRIRYVYFPGNSLVSLLTVVDQRRAMEVGMVGREGMIGLPLALGAQVSPARALVHGAGTAMRMESARFCREIRTSPHLQRGVHRYANALMAQVSQTAACNRFHVIVARLARWLLMTRDRVGSGELRLTHEFLAYLLGVRRVGITQAARRLRARKLIDYNRGSIRILDDRGLEAAACACYALLDGS